MNKKGWFFGLFGKKKAGNVVSDLASKDSYANWLAVVKKLKNKYGGVKKSKVGYLNREVYLSSSEGYGVLVNYFSELARKYLEENQFDKSVIPNFPKPNLIISNPCIHVRLNYSSDLHSSPKNNPQRGQLFMVPFKPFGKDEVLILILGYIEKQNKLLLHKSVDVKEVFPLYERYYLEVFDKNVKQLFQ